MNRNATTCSFSATEAWVILSPIEQSIKRKIEAAGTPLKDWDIQINYGIKTGYNEAFIITTEKRDEILANCADEGERTRTAELIRPILRGRDIKRYSYEWAGLWLIFVPWHFPLHLDPSIKGSSTKAENAFKEQYPSVYTHLLQYKDALSKRNKDETGIRYEWYALQRWGANYWEDFSKPKIMYAEIVQEPRFYFDAKGEYVPEATTFIMSGEHLNYLVRLLHSKLVTYAFKQYYAGGGLGDYGYRYKKAFIELLPIIKPTKEQESIITNAKSENEIESIVNTLYHLTVEEENFISQ